MTLAVLLRLFPLALLITAQESEYLVSTSPDGSEQQWGHATISRAQSVIVTHPRSWVDNQVVLPAGRLLAFQIYQVSADVDSPIRLQIWKSWADDMYELLYEHRDVIPPQKTGVTRFDLPDPVQLQSGLRFGWTMEETTHPIPYDLVEDYPLYIRQVEPPANPLPVVGQNYTFQFLPYPAMYSILVVIEPLSYNSSASDAQTGIPQSPSQPTSTSSAQTTPTVKPVSPQSPSQPTSASSAWTTPTVTPVSSQSPSQPTSASSAQTTPTVKPVSPQSPSQPTSASSAWTTPTVTPLSQSPSQPTSASSAQTKSTITPALVQSSSRSTWASNAWTEPRVTPRPTPEPDEDYPDVDVCWVQKDRCLQACLTSIGDRQCDCRTAYVYAAEDSTVTKCRDGTTCGKMAGSCESRCRPQDGRHYCDCIQDLVFSSTKNDCILWVDDNDDDLASTIRPCVLLMLSAIVAGIAMMR